MATFVIILDTTFRKDVPEKSNSLAMKSLEKLHPEREKKKITF